MTSRCRIVICLFRNDLRYLDNEALQWAHRNADKIVPLYCFDPRHFKGTYQFGFPKTGPFRTKFLIESVRDLRNTLNKHGSGLVVRHGHPETVIAELIQQLSAQGTVTTIALQQEVTSEELSVETGLKSECKVPLHTVWGHTLNHLQDVPFNPRQVPDVYTQFRKRVEGAAPIRSLVTMPDRLHPLPEGVEEGVIPSHADLGIPEAVADSRSAFPFHGGETEALSRLEYYLWSSDNVAKYKETRNGMVGHDYSTKFSPWLAHGCISPRQIYWEIKRYEEQRTSNQSTYWVIFELLWRDYFKFVALKYGNKLFFKDGILGKQIPWKQDKLQFAAWKEGRTGVPYVDANMREMAATGFMSNRGRQNVASFLTKDLGLDWRLGAEWFESQLVDHDVCSNYGNWLYSAGLGNDPRENRKFNMIKQGLDYDPEGEYVRLWVPELSTMPGGQVHTVWMAGKGLLARAGISLGETYPNPIVVAPEWSRHHGKAKSGTSRGASAHGKGGKQRGIDFYFKK